jgi:hypothetical protein
MQITINGAQAHALMEALGNYADGESVLFTAGHDGSVVVAFSLVTLTIAEDGEVTES